MAAMNQGASDNNGKILGVIHEMFVVDGSDWLEGSHGAICKSELLIARGDNLQERKRLLVDGADALIVLPGGPGTWDEVGGILVCRLRSNEYMFVFFHTGFTFNESFAIFSCGRWHVPGTLDCITCP